MYASHWDHRFQDDATASQPMEKMAEIRELGLDKIELMFYNLQ